VIFGAGSPYLISVTVVSFTRVECLPILSLKVAPYAEY